MEYRNLEDMYPLAEKNPDFVKTMTGKSLDDINMENVLEGNIEFEDSRIHKDTLIYQAEIAELAGNSQFANNLKRAAELTDVPDEVIFEVYNAIRPFSATKSKIIELADILENKYSAKENAIFIKQAAEMLEFYNRLKKDW